MSHARRPDRCSARRGELRAVRQYLIAVRPRDISWARRCGAQDQTRAAIAHRKSSMTKTIRRKSETVRLTNEREFPHLVELSLPPEGFRSILLEIDTFHHERRIPVRRGRNRHEVKQVYIRFCFPDTATADAFSNQIGRASCRERVERSMGDVTV